MKVLGHLAIVFASIFVATNVEAQEPDPSPCPAPPEPLETPSPPEETAGGTDNDVITEPDTISTGTSEATGTTEVAAPTNLTLTAASNSSLNASWSWPDGSPVDTYEVTVKALEFNNQSTVKTTNTFITLDNLVCFSNYTVDVLAVVKGQRGPVASATGQTWPGRSFKPSKPTMEYLSPSWIRVSWSPPEGLLGNVEMYRVLVKHLGVVIRTEELLPTQTIITLTGLDAGVKYEIYVQAKIASNNQGEGGGLGPEVLVTETPGPSGGGDRTTGGDRSSGGLSGGAIAGIVIGVLLAVIIIVLVVVMVLKRKTNNVLVNDFQWSDDGGEDQDVETDVEMNSLEGAKQSTSVDEGAKLPKKAD